MGLALISDTVDVSKTGSAIGWQAIGMFAGTSLGPSLGGIVFDTAGHFAVFGMAYTVLLFDIILRFVMIEKKVASKWLPVHGALGYGTAATDVSHMVSANDFHEQVKYTRKQRSGSFMSRASTESKSLNLHVPGIFSLLKSSRLLMALWSTCTCAILMTALESVLYPRHT